MFPSLPFKLSYKIASLVCTTALGERNTKGPHSSHIYSFQLSIEEQKNSRLTSKKFSILATSLVFQTVSLRLNNKHHYRRCMSLLEALGTPSYLSQNIKTLCIHGSFDPPYKKCGFWSKIRNRRRRAIRFIEKRLLGAIPSLASLKSLYFSLAFIRESCVQIQ
ncbi:hypothetical protein IW261DRAFT_480955 [Armillaria novae-zelandiae]|uniref:Uncharacterized protein n=1 Tax=Armillaria novae-zelandiae TaxID=153914 RepID=A0AA39P0U6_9AGAR|nr:hypothetical protein IW261DRAFT_480955 [Armillaria novae-zelandiae]